MTMMICEQEGSTEQRRRRKGDEEADVEYSEENSEFLFRFIFY